MNMWRHSRPGSSHCSLSYWGSVVDTLSKQFTASSITRFAKWSGSRIREINLSRNYSVLQYSIGTMKRGLMKMRISSSYDECCGKIDLFRVQNRDVHILSEWECCQIYQAEALFHERCSNFWLFGYQIYGCTLNSTNFTQFWRPKICWFL